MDKYKVVEIEFAITGAFGPNLEGLRTEVEARGEAVSREEILAA